MQRSDAFRRWAAAAALVAPLVALVMWWPGPRQEIRWVALALYLPIYFWSVRKDLDASAAIEDP